MSVVQRYMSVADEKKARRVVWTNAITVVPASILFFGVGTALFVFYRHFPASLNPFHKTDAVFPLFIANELPAGISGLVVAGIFAAAQSTISTSMNSTSTAFMADFVLLSLPRMPDKTRLTLARIMTLFFGLMGVILSILFAASDIKSLWDQFMAILGLLGGPMCGLFCLGIFTLRANGTGAILGAITGATVLFFVQRYTPIHFLLYTVIGIWVCFISGYLYSCIVPNKKPVDKSMTVYGIKPDNS